MQTLSIQIAAPSPSVAAVVAVVARFQRRLNDILSLLDWSELG